jgi:16S rRNA (uracil1498-N3)-methyltransferase
VGRTRQIAAERWFFLAEGESAGAPRLAEEDERHALRVLRLGAGDRVAALDGCGHLRELELVEVRADRPRWRATGECEFEPEPGAAGAPLPWLEVALSPPKGSRADELVERLTQLGVASIAFLAAERTQGFERDKVEARLPRWQRIAREACKQSKRLHVPRLEGPMLPLELRATRPALLEILLEPAAEIPLASLAVNAPLGDRAKPVRLWIGPEGGWTDSEAGALRSAGAKPASLSPHVLRVETAAESAAAILLHAGWTAHQSMRSRSET